MSKVARLPRLFLSMALGITILLCLAISGCSSALTSEPATSMTTTTTAATTLTPSPTPTPMPTAAATPTLNPTQPTVTPSPTVTPTPTIIPTPTIPPELVGVLLERLQFTKDLLNFYDKTVKESGNEAFNKIGSYINREQIINYGKGGEYLVKSGDVVKFKDGNPAVALINCNNNYITSFKKAITVMESYDPNYLKIITGNGARAFMIQQVSGGNDWFAFNKYGGIALNPTDLTLSRSDISNFLKRPIYTESLGIKMYQMGGDYDKYVGLMKESLASDCWWNLYCANKQEYCEAMSYSSYMIAKGLYSTYYKISFKDQKIQDLLNNIRTQNLVEPFGGTWAEIIENIPSRPDWNKGDIE